MRQKNIDDDYIKQAEYYDDNGDLIDDLQEWLDKPDEELAAASKQELSQIALLNAKCDFLDKIKTYSHMGIGNLLQIDHLDQFINHIKKKS